MSVKVGINGCGRIGKLLIRFLSESDNFEVAAVNDPMPSATLFNLLKYDSLHGKFFDVTEFNDDSILLNNRKIALFHETDPKNIPWGEYNKLFCASQGMILLIKPLLLVLTSRN